MTSEYLLDAIGLLDDDMIQDAEEGAKPAFHWRRWGAWAACLTLVVALGYGASQLGAGQDGSSADTAGGIPSSSSGEAGAANSDSTATAPGRTVSRERALSWYTGMARLTISSALWRSCRRTASFWAGWSGTTERPCTRTVRNMRAVKSGRTVADSSMSRCRTAPSPRRSWYSRRYRQNSGEDFVSKSSP